MKLLLERWRKLLEGEVIPFPQEPKVSEDDMQLVIAFENEVSDLLAEIYGSHVDWPTNIIEIFDSLVNAVEESLKK